MTRREVRSTPLKYEDETWSEARRLEGLGPEGWSMELICRHSNSIASNFTMYDLTPTYVTPKTCTSAHVTYFSFC